MGILSRFGEIMKSNINAALDKLEDPSKMIDQTLRTLREDLAQVKKETAAIMADEKNAKRQLDECQASISKYENAARNAVKSGNENDARTLLSKKQTLEANLASLQQNYDVAKSNADKMRQMHDKLAKDIEALEARKDSIKGKVAVAKAQQHVNKIVAGGTKSEASISAFERMEAKANKMLDSAQAEAELNADMAAEGDLVNKYSAGSSASVEEELAALKAEINGGATVNPNSDSVSAELEALKTDKSEV